MAFSSKGPAGHRRLAADPARVIALSFALVILTGTLLLALPISSREGVFTPLADCLFTATSATCVTGLVVYDTYTHWSPLGQGIILALIQVGGLGLVTLTTFFNIAIGKKLGLRGLHLAQESVASMGDDIGRLIKIVITTSLAVESAGALLLAFPMVERYGMAGVPIAVFTSVSAFCNAGFDLFGRDAPFLSLCGFAGDPLVLGVVGLLIIVGGIGFIVIYDLLQYRRTRKLLLHTRIVVVATAALLLTGTAFTALCEWRNPATIGDWPALRKLGASLFHSVSCRTAGFNVFPLEGMRPVTKLLSSILMFFGAAPGSTGGGIKITTGAVIFMTVWCVARGGEDTVIFHRRVAKGAVYKSLAVTVLAILGISITAGCILATMGHTLAVPGVDAVFESVSAFATVGLSVGVTGVANPLSRLLLIFLMYLGRLGPVSFFLSLAARATGNRKEILPEGKIQIG